MLTLEVMMRDIACCLSFKLVFSVICCRSVLNERSSKKAEQSTDAVVRTEKWVGELNDLQMRLNKTKDDVEKTTLCRLNSKNSTTNNSQLFHHLNSNSAQFSV